MIDAPKADEITEAEIGPLRLLMGVLEQASGIKNVEALELHASVGGQRFVIGWGESGDPAILLPTTEDSSK